MALLVWRMVIHTDDSGSIPPSMPYESSLLHRACLVRFTFPMWFADYYTVGDLPSAHPKGRGCGRAFMRNNLFTLGQGGCNCKHTTLQTITQWEVYQVRTKCSPERQRLRQSVYEKQPLYIRIRRLQLQTHYPPRPAYGIILDILLSQMEADISEKLLSEVQAVEDGEKEVNFKEKLWNETKKMWVIAAPAMFTKFSTFGVTVITHSFVGHIGPNELAAYALVSTVLLRFGNGILMGMASGLETLCGQSYGAKQYHMLGIYLQRSWIVLTVTTTLLLPLYIFTTPILKALGQNEEIAKEAGLISLCLEFWYSSILVLITGNLKNAMVQIGALSICLNINAWEMMISLGFLAAACVRVSNELGRGSAKAASFSIWNTATTSFVIGFILFLFFLFLRGRLSYLFTDSPDVAKEVEKLSPLLAFSILMNSIQPVLSGVAVGAGWQSIVAYVNIGCYYLVGIPVGVVLGYVFKLQVKGVWVGMIFGTLVQTIVLLIITLKTDWNKQVLIAQQRVKRWLVEDKTNDDSQTA
ncbi:hypothetical protein KY285_006105 [Solanum tuberosum]|nr:hypothetical protein KY289_007090 [Solanum tuberosum]KAH0752957.1 hypothetical protein KY285_006105 [Solanum tuberosum]